MLVRKEFIEDDYGSNLKRSSPDIKKRLTKLLSDCYDLGDNEIEGLFKDISEQTVQSILYRSSLGSYSFNVSVLGLYNASISRLIFTEQSTVTLNLYESDYFTFLFMSNLYKKLNVKEPSIFKIESIDNVNTLVPFFNSLGVGGFICFDRGYGLEILFARRGPNVSCPNHIHFTFDEAFSLKDQITDTTGNYRYDYIQCLKRAIAEEVTGYYEEVETRFKYITVR